MVIINPFTENPAGYIRLSVPHFEFIWPGYDLIHPLVPHVCCTDCDWVMVMDDTGVERSRTWRCPSCKRRLTGPEVAAVINVVRLRDSWQGSDEDYANTSEVKKFHDLFYFYKEEEIEGFIFQWPKRAHLWAPYPSMCCKVLCDQCGFEVQQYFGNDVFTLHIVKEDAWGFYCHECLYRTSEPISPHIDRIRMDDIGGVPEYHCHSCRAPMVRFDNKLWCSRQGCGCELPRVTVTPTGSSFYTLPHGYEATIVNDDTVRPVSNNAGTMVNVKEGLAHCRVCDEILRQEGEAIFVLRCPKCGFQITQQALLDYLLPSDSEAETEPVWKATDIEIEVVEGQTNPEYLRPRRIVKRFLEKRRER